MHKRYCFSNVIGIFIFNEHFKVIKKELFTNNEQYLGSVEKKNNLLTGIIDVDYLEMLYRKKFMVGKVNEKIYTK